jgi:hypothetical protein
LSFLSGAGKVVRAGTIKRGQDFDNSLLAAADQFDDREFTVNRWPYG